MRTADLAAGARSGLPTWRLSCQDAVRLCVVEPVRLSKKSLDVTGLPPRPGLGSVLCTGPVREIGPLF
jgi:hypothetical protein